MRGELENRDGGFDSHFETKTEILVQDNFEVLRAGVSAERAFGKNVSSQSVLCDAQSERGQAIEAGNWEVGGPPDSESVLDGLLEVAHRPSDESALVHGAMGESGRVTVIISYMMPTVGIGRAGAL